MAARVSFPKSLDTLFGASEHVAKRVSAATGGKFDLRVFAAGEIVPPLGVVDAVQQGNVECAHTSAYFFFGKDATFALDTGISFGMKARQMTAWSLTGRPNCTRDSSCRRTRSSADGCGWAGR